MSRSVKLDYDRLRNPGAVTLYQCFECATCTTNLPDASGVSLCDNHKDGTHDTEA